MHKNTTVPDIRIGLAVIVISDRASSGERPDQTIPLVNTWCRGKNIETVLSTVVPDRPDEIRRALEQMLNDERVEVIITSGGTGLAERDVTPEVTAEYIEKRTPGIDAYLSEKGREKTPYAILSRGISGIAGNHLVINLPGNPQAVVDGLEWLLPVLGHALRVLRGPVDDSEHRVE